MFRIDVNWEMVPTLVVLWWMHSILSVEASMRGLFGSVGIVGLVY